MSYQSWIIGGGWWRCLREAENNYGIFSCYESLKNLAQSAGFEERLLLASTASHLQLALASPVPGSTEYHQNPLRPRQ